MAEWERLLSACPGNRPEGSNPSLSARWNTLTLELCSTFKAQWVNGLAVSLQSCSTSVRFRPAPLAPKLPVKTRLRSFTYSVVHHWGNPKRKARGEGRDSRVDDRPTWRVGRVRLNAPVLKTGGGRKTVRGFESHTLRMNRQFMPRDIADTHLVQDDVFAMNGDWWHVLIASGDWMLVENWRGA